MLTFSELQAEVKRRAIRNQSGTEFDTAVKNTINTSLFRISREASWRVMRRKTSFDTITAFTSTTNCAVTNSATSATLTGATLFASKIEVGRKIKFGTDNSYYTIKAIPAETILTLDRLFEGTSSTNTTYSILSQEEYTIPMQAGHRLFLWHEDLGYPYRLEFITDQDFFNSGVYITEENTPTHYRMWGENMISVQVPSATVITIASSSVNDSSTNITIFGNVGGYPFSETVTTSGASGAVAVSTTNKFETIEKVVVGSNTSGKITIGTILGSYTNVVIPAGSVSGVLRKKVQLYPLPTRIFPINVYYYKDPFPLTNDEDIHDFGQDFDEAIILLATAKIKYQDDQKEGDRFLLMYQDEIRNLKKTNMDKIDWTPSLQKPYGGTSAVHKFLRYSQIGSDFGPATNL